MNLYEKIINKNLLVRRINICANNVITEEENNKKNNFEQLNLFSNFDEMGRAETKKKEHEQAEKNIQKAMIQIKQKYGKNAIIKGMNLQEGGTTIDRNKQVGGHKA